MVDAIKTPVVKVPIEPPNASNTDVGETAAPKDDATKGTDAAAGAEKTTKPEESKPANDVQDGVSNNADPSPERSEPAAGDSHPTNHSEAPAAGNNDAPAGDRNDAPAAGRNDTAAAADNTAAAAPHADGAHGATGAHEVGHTPIVVPAPNANIVEGSTGPMVPEGDARTIKVPDGDGFFGEEGRKQNADDKKQNNYSVTDANFSPEVGLLKDPATGEPYSYVKQIQLYNAVGYVKTFAPETYEQLVQAQNSGQGTILGGAGALMGLPVNDGSLTDELRALAAGNIPRNIPGSNRDARSYIVDAQDATGQDWARMHHPESAWDMYSELVGAGVPANKAFTFAGDDGVSGAGRLNGFNNQDGQNGFNAGELEIFKEAAQYQQQTGIPAVQIMMSGHDHTGLHPSAKTVPAINKLLTERGLPLATGDVSASDYRAGVLYQALLDGRANEPKNNNNDNGGGGNNGGGDAAAANGGGGAQEQPGVRGPFYAGPSYALAPEAHTGLDIALPQVGDTRFVDGSVGPVVPEGQAATIKIPDGAGFGGLEGRKQNANDKKQNNYSVTDANFSPQLGLLTNPATGEPYNYVQQIQLYNAAGYVKTFAPALWDKLVAMQNAGQGTILELVGRIFSFEGLERDPNLNPDPMTLLTDADIAEIPLTIPGTDLSAEAYVKSPQDITGQDWARMHHPESAWDMYKNLVANGVDGRQALILASDDGVSGAGRLNGFNNQDGGDSFNADEAAVFKLAAQIEQQTGIPVVQIMMSGHDHTGLDESAKTNPTINKILGLAETDRSASPERARILAQALLNGAGGLDIGNLDQFTAKNESILKTATGQIAPLPAQPAAIAPGAAPLTAAAGGGAMAMSQVAATYAAGALPAHAHA